MVFREILLRLQQNHLAPLSELAQKLHVGSRTIQQAIKTETGQNFRILREKVLIDKVKTLLLAEPTLSVKAISFNVGYRSPRSFARAIRRATGISPEELRSATAEGLLAPRVMAAN